MKTLKLFSLGIALLCLVFSAVAYGKKKNRTDMLVASDVETFKRADFVKLKFPAKWKRGTKRTLLESWGEGTPVELEAYLIKTKH